MLLPDLSRRRLEAELMDDPALDASRHIRALGALRTVNLLSRTTARIWAELLHRGLAPGRPLRVLDVACGGGDVVVALGRRAAAAGLPLVVDGCDRSPVALEYARARAAEREVSASFLERDVLDGPLPSGYDLFCSSLFLHHLTEREAVRFLASMADAVDAFFVQDLRRTLAGYALAMVTLHTLARSDVARVDGLRSVAGAFTLKEVSALVDEAGLRGAALRRCWPQRFALSWSRD